jgi:Na+/melibiose symporter-like transporter
VNDKVILLIVLAMLLGVFVFVFLHDPNQNNIIMAGIVQWITGVIGAIGALTVQARTKERDPKKPEHFLGE